MSHRCKEWQNEYMLILITGAQYIYAIWKKNSNNRVNRVINGHKMSHKFTARSIYFGCLESLVTKSVIKAYSFVFILYILILSYKLQCEHLFIYCEKYFLLSMHCLSAADLIDSKLLQ